LFAPRLLNDEATEEQKAASEIKINLDFSNKECLKRERRRNIDTKCYCSWLVSEFWDEDRGGGERW
jgi:hypothetical protein